MIKDKLIKFIDKIYDDLEYDFEDLDWDIKMINNETIGLLNISDEDKENLYCLDSFKRIYLIEKKDIIAIVSHADKQIEKLKELEKKHIKIKGYH